MLLFNWKKIYEKAEGSSNNVIEILHMLHKKKIPYNKYDPLYKYMGESFSGDSFLLAPDALLDYAFKYDSKEVAVYIALASRRKLADYIAFNKKTLSVRHAPQLIDLINQNRLLFIEDGEIYFIYEEAHRRK